MLNPNTRTRSAMLRSTPPSLRSCAALVLRLVLCLLLLTCAACDGRRTTAPTAAPTLAPVVPARLLRVSSA